MTRKREKDFKYFIKTASEQFRLQYSATQYLSSHLLRLFLRLISQIVCGGNISFKTFVYRSSRVTLRLIVYLQCVRFIFVQIIHRMKKRRNLIVYVMFQTSLPNVLFQRIILCYFVKFVELQ